MHAALELHVLAGSPKRTGVLAHFSQELHINATEFDHPAAALRPASAMRLRMPAGLTSVSP